MIMMGKSIRQIWVKEECLLHLNNSSLMLNFQSYPSIFCYLFANNICILICSFCVTEWPPIGLLTQLTICSLSMST